MYLPRGIYTINPDGFGVPNAKPHVAGAFVKQDWNDIEPTKDTYNWSYIDSIVAQAELNGVHLKLGIRRGLVGDGLPNWLAGQGCVMLTATDGTTGPLATDPVYLAEWKQVNRKLVERYDASPAVKGFHFSFYTWQTLDWSEGSDGNQADIDALIAAGFTRLKLKNAIKDALATVTAVGTKPLLTPVAPTVDEVLAKKTMAATVAYVIDPLYELYGPAGTSRPNRFAVGRTVFNDQVGDPLQIWNTKGLGAQFQAIYDKTPYVYGQRDFPYAFTPETYEIMLDIALHYGCQFFEIGLSTSNDNNYQPILQAANDAMLADGGHVGH
jgi:hypothetical protein